MTPTIPYHLNVLLVDDDADDHEFFLHAIAKAKIPTHIKIKTLKDGSEITRALLNGYGRLPDIIFLDINMPSKNGHEILQEIRRQKKLNDVAIAIFTTSSSEYDIYKAHENGANLYIKKPDEVLELATIMEKVLALNWKHHQPYSTIDKFVWEKQNRIKW